MLNVRDRLLEVRVEADDLKPKRTYPPDDQAADPTDSDQPSRRSERRRSLSCGTFQPLLSVES